MTIRTQRLTPTLGPAAPGSATDLVGRAMAEGLARRPGQTVGVASRTCASGSRSRRSPATCAATCRMIARMAATRPALTLREGVPARDETGQARILAVLGPKRLTGRADGPTGRRWPRRASPTRSSAPSPRAGCSYPRARRSRTCGGWEKEAMAIVQSTPMKARSQVFGLEAVKGGSERCRRESEARSPITEKPGRISGARLEAAAPNDVPVREHGVAPDPRRPAARTGPRIRRCRA